ncbi:MAG: DNA-directed RNA polymerase subunit L [Candidatus Micrarchaeota archaeon]|nr:MAG: DNA-directed RNA polymerase subunit L [Candidatus Micrarchaeota archaeon]
MSVKVIKDSKDELVLEFDGTDTTVADLVSSYLTATQDVEFAGVYKSHPEIGNPQLIIKAKNPKDKLNKALSKIENDLDTILKAIK